MTSPNPIESQIEGLQSSVLQLSDLTSQLTLRQADQLKRIERTVRMLIIGFVIMVVLLAGGVYLGYRSVQTSNDIRGNQRTIQEIQRRTSTDAFCPLYDIFLDSYNPTSPQALEDPAAYESAFVTIERGAAALGCGHRTKGKD